MSKKKKKFKKKKDKEVNWRITALFLLLSLFATGLVARLYYLQIMQGDYYGALAVGQRVDVNNSPPPRGDIYFQDKAGSARYVAATNKEVPLVYAVPSAIDDQENIIERLDQVLDFSDEQKGEIEERLKNKASSYALIARHLTDEQASTIKELDLENVHVRNEFIRHYPAGPIAAHAVGFLGFSGSERMGQYGTEKHYDDLLSGKSIQGFSFSSVFAGGADASADIELTIDYGVQFVLEKKLEELYERWDPDSVSAIFMDPKTGAIIAMENIPSFDPNEYNEVEDINIFNNSLVQSRFELGSVFKPITIAAAIDAGAISPTTTYEDTGRTKIGSYTIRNSDGEAHGVQTMTEALEKSLNTGMIFAQEKMGKRKFLEYLEAFELDQETGVDLPNEVPGNIRNIQTTTRDINYATASFGQGISFSPLRFLSSVSAIANDGVIMKPYIVNKVVQNGEEIATEPEEMAKPVTPLTASKVTAMMVSVVENGFGAKAAVPGYAVAGKTGTAQIPKEDDAGYSDKTIQSFVGFAPAYDPRFIGIIKMDNPKGVRFASDSIAPVFGEITNFLLQYYQIPPQ